MLTTARARAAQRPTGGAAGVDGTRSRPWATDPVSPDGAQPQRGSARVPRGPAIPAAPARRPRRRALADASSADDAVLLHAEPRDTHLDDVAGLEVARRLHPVGDTGRRAGRDDVAGSERHEAAHVGDELADREDHVGGAAALASVAVDRRPQQEGLGVARL